MLHGAINYASSSTQTSSTPWNEGEHSVAQKRDVAIQLFVFPSGIQYFPQITTLCSSITYILRPHGAPQRWSKRLDFYVVGA